MSLAAKHPIKWTIAQFENRGVNGAILISDRGPVVVEGPVSAVKLRDYQLDEGLKMFRCAEQQKKALIDIAGSDGFVFVARFGKKVIGYVTYLPPDTYLNWGDSEVPDLLELGAIEVSNDWRRRGIGEALLRESFNRDTFENHIVISTEYYWHWDLEKSGLSIWEYSNMLSSVLGKYGFELWNTNDPDILSHPANTFMVRVGNRVPGEVIAHLKTLVMHRGNGTQ
jgi:acetoin utilization protein AcuA